MKLVTHFIGHLMSDIFVALMYLKAGLHMIFDATSVASVSLRQFHCNLVPADVLSLQITTKLHKVSNMFKTYIYVCKIMTKNCIENAPSLHL